MLVRTIFKAPPARIMDHDLYRDSEFRTSLIDNLVANLLSGQLELIEICDYSGEPDHHDDLSEEDDAENALFIEVALDVDEELTADWKNNKNEISTWVAGTLQENYWSIFSQWERSTEEHLGIMAIHQDDKTITQNLN